MLKTREDLQIRRRYFAESLREEKKRILVCAGTGCISSGSLDIFHCLQKLMEQNHIPCSVELAEEPHGEVVGIKKSGCHGFCEMGPLVRIEPEGWLYVRVKPEDCREIIDKTIMKGQNIERLAYQQNGEICKKQDDIPFYKKQTRLVLQHCGHINAASIKEYLAIGGYSAFEKALFDMTGD